MKALFNNRVRAAEDAGIERRTIVASQGLSELSGTEIDIVAGGNVFYDAFEVGWDIGTAIDRRFIKPLWN